jgi:uncharacterized protein
MVLDGLVRLKGSCTCPAYEGITRERRDMSSNPSSESKKPNHLIHEKSPYLRQHAHNPVRWYPWGEEPFRRAADENKPVFVSIGYATCHWCHVMAHESFEDEAVAAVLNEHFIAVKVDREERPDIDGVYMTVCQQMTGQGGWPLTVILTPKKEPFFAGTYFPPTTRGGRIGLIDLLSRISRLWNEQRMDLETSARRITAALREEKPSIPKDRVDTILLVRGFQDLASRFDPENGGFGGSPKFPTPSTILFLLRFWKRTGSDHALMMAEKTLEGLVCGGIHDHLGGGFHRYATDAQWRIPHFEKMLYDQALILTAFTEAWLATKKPVYRQTAEAIIEYVLRDLQSLEGGFASAEDADSADGEGAYYTWTRKEIDTILGPKDGDLAAGLFGVTEGGNFSIPESGRMTNVLFLSPESIPSSQIRYRTNDNELQTAEIIRKKLLTARNKRPRPQLDNKILTDWNALFITALAGAYRAFGDTRYRDAAKKAMFFILSHLRSPDGGLLHRYCDDEAAIPAFADDYAFMIQALIQLYEATFDPEWLETAISLDRYMAGHFLDSENGGFFTTADYSDPLILRRMEIYDGVTPSGNSIMIHNLVWLGHLTGNPVFHERATSLAQRFAATTTRSLSAYTAYLSGVDLLLGPVTNVVIAGGEDAPDTQAMINDLWQDYLPSAMVVGRFSGKIAAGLDSIAPFTRDMVPRNGRATAYVCHGETCSEPVTRPEDLVKRMREKNRG